MVDVQGEQSATPKLGDDHDPSRRKLLARRRNGLTARQIIEALRSKRMWKPRRGGKTPVATLLAALHSELAGEEGRFARIKTEAGVVWVTA